MATMVKEGEWKCDTCGQTFAKKGWCEVHERNKHGGAGENNNVGKTRPKNSKKDEPNGLVVCPECKSKNARLLNTCDPQEAYVKRKGYKYYCKDCEEVW